AAFLVIYVGFAAFELYFERQVGQPVSVVPPSLAALSAASVLYALYRVYAFHPHFRPAYRQWLQTTPWTLEKALPLGPIHLVGQDVVILGLAVALAWPIHQLKGLYVLEAFIIAYSLAMSFALWGTGEKLSAFSVWFGLGGMIYTCRSLPFFVVVAVC